MLFPKSASATAPISIGEIERGSARQRATDPGFAAALAGWLDKVLTLYGERIVPFDLRTARRWGALSAALGNESVDLMIAATALEHGLTVVTHNVSDFGPTGVAVLDPFAAGSRGSRRRHGAPITGRYPSIPSRRPC
ncbi:MAG TPA: type II toxin-antitoxin system VapC family toxin [Bradyrhizobium sp.]|nr:type II toxin-antitoxin system VapC family toxin [Bradyrhizobium sp.]